MTMRSHCKGASNTATGSEIPVSSKTAFSLTIAATLALAAPDLANTQPADTASEWQAPRTPWGDPDLQGMWPIDHINGTPLQRPPEFGERRFLTDEEYAEREQRLAELNARYDNEIANNEMNMGHWVEMGAPNRLTSLVYEPADGRLPALTDAGERKSATMTSTWSEIPFDSIDDFNALDRCITRGMPASMFPFMYNSGIEILQAPGYVIVRLELIHETRIVPLDGGSPASGSSAFVGSSASGEALALDEGGALLQWMGISRGRFDGDTLVIETTNFNGETPMIIVGPGAKPIPTSPAMRIVERLTRVAPDTIDYEIEVEDPVMLTRPWKAAFPWKLNPDYRFFEYACHEGNNIIRDMINTTRVERARLEGEQAR